MKKIVVFLLLLFVVESYGQLLWEAELLEHTTIRRVENKRLKEEVRVRLLVRNRSGDKYNFVQIPYSLSNKVENLTASIKSIDGKVLKKLKKSDIVERSYMASFSMYEDDLLMSFQLTSDTYPQIFEYSYTQEYNRFMNIVDWIPSYTEIPSTGAKLVVTVPNYYRINIFQQNIDDPNVVFEEDQIKYTWTHKNIHKVKNELFSPNKYELLPRVRISPVDFNYGVKGSHATWKSYGKWQSDLNEGLDVLPEDELKRLLEVTSVYPDTLDKVRAVYHYMQDRTRYVNISIDIGGLKPYPASYVSENGFGDCKALTNYMQSMLKALGIKSYYVTLYAGERHIPYDKTYVGHQSNHVVLCVPTAGDTLWLENTDNTNPFGYVGTFIQNRTGLFVDGYNSRLVELPALRDEQVTDEWNMEYTLTPQSELLAEVNATMRGRNFELFKSIMSWNEADKLDYMRENLPHGDYKLLDWKIIDKGRDSTTIELAYTASLRHSLKQYGDLAVLEVDKIDIPLFESVAERTTPVRINYPVNKKCSYQFRSEGKPFKEVSISSDTTITSEFGRYSITLDTSEEAVKLEKEFYLNRGSIPLSDYADFYTFIAEVNLIESRLKLLLKYD